MREHKGRGGIACNDDEVGPVIGDQFGYEATDTGNQFLLRLGAIRKEGVVRHIEISRVGSCLGDLTKDRQAAQSGIEDQNGWGRAHAQALRNTCALDNSAFEAASGGTWLDQVEVAPFGSN